MKSNATLDIGEQRLGMSKSDLKWSVIMIKKRKMNIELLVSCTWNFVKGKKKKENWIEKNGI